MLEDVMRAFAPWRGAHDPGLWRRWWLRCPATFSYAAGTTLLFLIFVTFFDGDEARVPSPLIAWTVYHVPGLFTNPLTGVHLVTAVWLNPNPVQLGYVLALLALFGVPFELHEGSRRAAGVFYITSILAGILAGGALHVIRAFHGAAWVDHAWQEPWVGGSAGCFGLMGAVAARARRPALLLGVYFVWELGVEAVQLQNYTPTFHMVAAAAGFLLTRWYLPDRRASPT